MAVFNGAFPILPGKAEAARSFARETLKARRAEFDEYQRRRGVTRETWSVHETPDGHAFSVVWFEADDPAQALALGVSDESPFGAWFKARVKEINGVDLDAGPPPSLPEQTLDWPETA